MSRSPLALVWFDTELDEQVPGHAHVRHVGPAEDRHEGRGAPARPRPTPRKGESEKMENYSEMDKNEKKWIDLLP